MKRAKNTAPTEADKRIAPDDLVLEQFSKLPEDVKRMVVCYGYGMIAGKQIGNDSGSGKTA